MLDDEDYSVKKPLLKKNKAGRSMRLRHGDFICIWFTDGIVKVEIDYSEVTGRFRHIRGRVVDDSGRYHKDVYIDMKLPVDIMISRIWFNSRTRPARIISNEIRKLSKSQRS
jgi:hypothetical protein